MPENHRSLVAHEYKEETMTTPPLPSSSPAPAMDVMEMSPLPHKPSFAAASETSIKSPTVDSSSLDSPFNAARSPLVGSPLEPHKDALQE